MVLGAFITFLCGFIKLNMNKYGNLIIMLTSIVQCVTLYTSIVYNSIYISYMNYIVYCSIYQGMMTIARLVAYYIKIHLILYYIITIILNIITNLYYIIYSMVKNNKKYARLITVYSFYQGLLDKQQI